MPRLIEAEIGNLAPRQMLFALPDALRDTPVVYRLEDGSLVMDAVPLIADQDLLYFAYELPVEELFGLALDWTDGPAEGGKIKWDQPLTGRLTQECAEFTLDQFEGLPITDGHTDVEVGRRNEVAVGTFLRDAVLDGKKVRSKALVYVAESILKVETGGSELSIGGMAFMEVNLVRGQAGEPDFFIRRINLNHVALVEKGRAGPEARLLNHRAELAHSKEKVPHMKVTISGVDIEVPDVAVNHYTGLIANLEGQVTNLTNSVTSVTAERDTAQGGLDAATAALTTAQEQVTTLQNAVPDVAQAAATLANEHTSFVSEAQRLGHTEELTLGAYDRAAVMRTVLNARGAAIADDASAERVAGAWDFALKHAAGSTSAITDLPLSQQTTAPPATIAAAAQTAVNNSYFGGKKKEA
mgnify:FL=1